jgi:hypothetical protein
MKPMLDYDDDAATVADLVRGLVDDCTRWIPAVTRIDIVDDWVGLSHLAPLSKIHRIESVQDHYVGESKFQIGGMSSSAGYQEPLFASAPIMISSDRVSRFLEALGECPIKLGVYTPVKTHTDDYPDVRIAITVNRSTITIRSESQQDFPWQVEIDYFKWTVPTNGPAEALQLLAPSLNPETYASLFAKATEKTDHDNAQ